MWSNVYKIELYAALGYSYTVYSSSDRRTLPSHASNTMWKPCPPWYPQISAGLPQIWLRQGLLLINPPQVAFSAVHPHFMMFFRYTISDVLISLNIIYMDDVGVFLPSETPPPKKKNHLNTRWFLPSGIHPAGESIVYIPLGLAVARENQGSMRHCEWNRGWCTDWMDFLEPKCPELEEDSHSKLQHHVNILNILLSIPCVQQDFILSILDILCHLSFSALLPNMLELFVHMCRTLCLKLLVFRTSTSTWNWWDKQHAHVCKWRIRHHLLVHCPTRL